MESEQPEIVSETPVVEKEESEVIEKTEETPVEETEKTEEVENVEASTEVESSNPPSAEENVEEEEKETEETTPEETVEAETTEEAETEQKEEVSTTEEAETEQKGESEMEETPSVEAESTEEKTEEETEVKAEEETEVKAEEETEVKAEEKTEESEESMKRPSEAVPEEPVVKKAHTDEQLEVLALVNAKVVGSIIGRGGSKIKALKEETKCRVNIEDAPFMQGERSQSSRAIRYIGTFDQICVTQKKIWDELKQFDDEQNTYPSLETAVVDTTGPEAQLTCGVPARAIGYLIGTGGTKVREMKESSGCHISLDDKIMNASGSVRHCRFEGTVEAVQKGIEVVKATIEEWKAENPANDEDVLSLTMVLPRSSIGYIIGHGGAAVRELNRQTNTLIKVFRSDNRQMSEQPLVIIGKMEDIFNAELAILEKIKEND
eukprot:TRINITY_DN66_c0_g1_i5.p1 TRINITY_DN66_c0_g1~~TRINITY_DN66_c0_g1_i5.p1  ORF type:complete len:435 (-),score=233.86 TRINITY_DN66_c0_g1_i5:833-2137(-)